MKAIPYLTYSGSCEEAVLFYQSVLGGEAQFVRFGDLPEEEGISVGDAWKAKVMHGSLTFGDGVVIYFSDSWENQPVTVGTNATVHLAVASEDEVKRIVSGLSEGGEVTMPAEKVFWGAVYGSLIDKYGVQWGVEYELPQ